MSFLKIWGCEVFVRKLILKKLCTKSDKCFFVMYPKETKGYYFYNPFEGKVFVTRYGLFLEKEFLSKGTSGSRIDLEEIRETEAIPPPNEEEIHLNLQSVVVSTPVEPVLCRCERSNFGKDPVRYGFLVTEHYDLLLVQTDEPRSYKEAMMGSDSEKWLEAMKSDMESMYYNQV
ncbi:uncharacterized protein LOC141631101 [Silene latifolia]|uniref:uncharacterized protein LOC141631101 n=1 Tax=Silene latifolia TaxID=37657 RepID=UPI003D76F200